MPDERVTVPDLIRFKERGRPLVVLTAYDYPLAALVDAAGVDVILVGDSLGDNVLGFVNTLSVTTEMMVHHTAAVSRGTNRALVVADMPFLSYQVDVPDAVRNAGRLIREGGAAAVKLEGAGARSLAVVAALVETGIPVMGHVGYTPQSTHLFGKWRVRGKDRDTARRVVESARKLQEAGCFAIVLECTPAPLSALITRDLDIPTIGIGAGPDCDGQVLVLHDVLNLGVPGVFRPRFARQYADVGGQVLSAVKAYAGEVRTRTFPTTEHSFAMPAEVLAAVEKEVSEP